MNTRAALLLTAIAILPCCPAAARTWTDTSGKYTVDAELVAFTDDTVILQRADHHLAAVEIAKLSEEDQEYLKSDEAKETAEKVTGKEQAWTMQSGIKVIGSVVNYVRKDLTVQRRRGKIYANDRVFDNLPAPYQKIVPAIVAHFEGITLKDKKALEGWLTHKKGQPQTYACEGVMLELPAGDEYAVPFFMFSEEDQQLLKPGWDEWLAAQGDHEAQADSSFELQSLAAARQRNSEVNTQIAKLQLGLQAVEAGVTNLWEVTLYPDRNNSGSPLWVVAPGRDSRTASQYAMRNNPGYVAGPVRRVSN